MDDKRQKRRRLILGVGAVVVVFIVIVVAIPRFFPGIILERLLGGGGVVVVGVIVFIVNAVWQNPTSGINQMKGVIDAASGLLESVGKFIDQFLSLSFRIRPPASPGADFYIVYAVGSNDDKHTAEEIIKPALENRCTNCSVVLNSWGEQEDFHLLLQTVNRAGHVIFIISPEFLNRLRAKQQGEITGVLLQKMMQLADKNTVGRRKGTAIVVKRMNEEEEILKSTNLFYIPLYEQMYISPQDAQNKLMATIPCPATQSLPPSPAGQNPVQGVEQGSTPPLIAAQTNGAIPPPQLINTQEEQPEMVGYNVPRENAAFVKRDAMKLLDDLDKSDNCHGIHILWGFHGVGKTELVLKFAHQYGQKTEENRRYRAVLWVDASKGLAEGLKALNVYLSSNHPKYLTGATVPSQDTELKKALLDLKRWLSAYEKKLGRTGKEWLLIIDRCSKQDFEEFQKTAILDILSHGVIFFTMRQFPGSGVDSHRVDGMKTNEGAMLLLRTKSDASKSDTSSMTHSQTEWEAAITLSEKLAGNTLALYSAGAYMRGIPKTVQEYLKEYDNDMRILYTEEQWQQDNNLGSYIVDDSQDDAQKSTDTHIARSVYSVFRVAFNELKRLKTIQGQNTIAEAAEEILHLCAFLDFKLVPIGVLSYNSPPSLNSRMHDGVFRLLHNLSFITYADRSNAFQLEKVLRDVIRVRFYPEAYEGLSKDDEMRLKRQAIYTIGASFAHDLLTGNQDLLSLYIVHIKVCLSYIKELKDQKNEQDLTTTITSVKLLYHAGKYLLDHPEDAEEPEFTAEALLKLAIEVRQQLPSTDTSEPDLATCLHAIANMHCEKHMIRYDTDLQEAEQHCLDAMKFIEQYRQPGTKDYDLACIPIHNSLGMIHTLRHNSDQAKEQFRIGIEACKRHLPSLVGLPKVRLLLDEFIMYSNKMVVCGGDDKYIDASQDDTTASSVQKEDYERLYKDATKILKAAKKILSGIVDSPEKEDLQRQLAALEEKHKLHKADFDIRTSHLLEDKRRWKVYERIEEIYKTIIEREQKEIDQAEKEKKRIAEVTYIQFITLCNNLAELYRIWGKTKHEEAKQYYGQALSYYYHAYEKAPAPYHPIVYVIWENRHMLSKLDRDEEEYYTKLDKTFGIRSRLQELAQNTSVAHR